MDGELALQKGWLYRGLALQGNVVQARAEQGLQKQARTYIYIAVSQKRLTV